MTVVLVSHSSDDASGLFDGIADLLTQRGHLVLRGPSPSSGGGLRADYRCLRAALDDHVPTCGVIDPCSLAAVLALDLVSARKLCVVTAGEAWERLRAHWLPSPSGLKVPRQEVEAAEVYAELRRDYVLGPDVAWLQSIADQILVENSERPRLDPYRRSELWREEHVCPTDVAFKPWICDRVEASVQAGSP